MRGKPVGLDIRRVVNLCVLPVNVFDAVEFHGNVDAERGYGLSVELLRLVAREAK